MGILERDSGTQTRAKQEYNRKKRQKGSQDKPELLYFRILSRIFVTGIRHNP